MSTDQVAAQMISAHPSNPDSAPSNEAVSKASQELAAKNKKDAPKFEMPPSKEDRRKALIEFAVKKCTGMKVGANNEFTITGLGYVESTKTKTWVYLALKGADGKEPVGLLVDGKESVVEVPINEVEAMPELKDKKPETVLCYKKEYWAKKVKASKKPADAPAAKNVPSKADKSTKGKEKGAVKPAF
jgi:hypothetical protein